MKKLYPTIGLFVAVLILMLSISAGYYYLYHAIGKNNVKVSQTLTESAFEIKVDRRLTSLSGIVADSAPARKKLDAVFVSREGLDFIEKLEQVAAHAGVTLSKNLNTDTLPSEYTSVAETITADIQLSGSWSDLFYFVELVESLPHKIEIDAMTFSKQGDTGVWKGNMNLRVLKHKT